MKISDFLYSEDEVINNKVLDIDLVRPCCDTRRLNVGDAFFAIGNGIEFVAKARKKGASIVFGERKESGVDIVVKDIRERFAKYSSAYYGHPENRLKVIAVTGTNGKTSTVRIIAHILNSVGTKAATIGTLGAEIGDEHIDTGFTTPDSDMFYYLLRRAADSDMQVVVMELSAHAIYYKKTAGVTFDICVFTNMTRDHLDFFKNMDNYAKTKKSVFVNNCAKTAIINIDDDLGKEIFCEKNGNKYSYGIYENSDYFATDINNTKSEYTVINRDNEKRVVTDLYGEFNIYNVLASVATCSSMGVSIDEIAISLRTLNPIPGRFNVKIYRGITVVIDYAHTPDGLEKVLITTRGIVEKRLVCVFGCGGDRDRTKRSLMGTISEKYADFSVITSDNPRFENPQDIIDEIKSGFLGDKYIAVIDREEAIYYALNMAREGDLVLIAGKGAEEYLDIRGEKIPYSDRAVCEAYFEGR